MRGAGFLRVNAAGDSGAVFLHALSPEGALLAGDALDHDFFVFANNHSAASTALAQASSMVG